jgi:hypothetical protein
MKRKILISLIAISSGLTMNAQWNGTNPVSTESNVGIGTSTVLNGLQIYKLNDFDGGSIRFGYSGANDAVFSFGWNPSTSNDAFKLSYYPHNSTTGIINLYTIGINGNFGIGTTNPQYKLDVIGTIRAREIKVDLNGADFVFENTYKLMPLNELDNFIKDKKHLPEIAPANEMEKNGTDLGILTSKLLQKIEELTLYTIEQNKKLEEQNKEFKILKAKIKKLESNKR